MSDSSWLQGIVDLVLLIAMVYFRDKFIQQGSKIEEVKTKVSNVKTTMYERTGALNTLHDEKAMTMDDLAKRVTALEQANIGTLHGRLDTLEATVIALKAARAEQQNGE